MTQKRSGRSTTVLDTEAKGHFVRQKKNTDKRNAQPPDLRKKLTSLAAPIFRHTLYMYALWLVHAMRWFVD